MFWGLIMEPNKRYTQVVEKPFHISQAALDISTGDNEACQVMVVVESKNFLVATLQKTKQIQVPLDLYFKAGDAISFLTNGKSNVHLTGYLDPEFEDMSGDEEEEEEDEEEAPELVPVNTKNKRKLETSNDAAAKKPKQDKKAAKKAPAADDSDASDDDDDDQLAKFLDGEDVDTDENDESFKVNTSADDSDEEDSDEEEEDDDDSDEEAPQQNGDAESSDEAEAETTVDSTLETDIDTSKLSKSAKRRLKKKLAQEKAAGAQVNGKAKKADEKPPQQKAEKKEQQQKAKKEIEPAEKKEKKALSGGVAIEDLKVGNGPVAKPGKVVQVYYEGRLKSNNKMFDNCLKGPGFKFRLGSKEVISGWDIGVAGMKVGGKRKIVCPPAMAYGAKGSPPVIPPNSTLVFEVELKNVK
ncbi:46 kDa FK506-binding nuclear protein isoform X2 [Plutella xylostella]|uniref:46 kDa FK506-binding nuclear protein isoform X2 n=1 Tax=Plutella xylostella TaxID=51655 RepID=UPI002032E074|nr:46 kDa FK506-binding nuclear protein isoform X2 [Plutella xylostella]